MKVADGLSVTDMVRALIVMRAFAENWGLMKKLARGLAKFENAFVAARPPWRQVKISSFAACSQKNKNKNNNNFFLNIKI